MIIAYVYDFPHFKSAQGLFALKRAGFDRVLAIAAPWKNLDIAESHFQFKTADMPDAHHPREVCKALGYQYDVLEHDSPQAVEALKACDAGLILGARVLGPDVTSCGVPVINLHPGVMPANRGLDTLKWAVHDMLPQAITAHVIDHRIDRGALISERIVPVHMKDSYADIYNRMMWTQIDMLPSALMMAHLPSDAIGKGTYRKPMNLPEDVATKERFAEYKFKYADICDAHDGVYAVA